MDHIKYVPKLTEMYRSLGFPDYNWSVHDSTPFTPVRKPLEESCITMIASSGIFRDDQEPFEPDGWPVNEVGIRLIPKDTDVKRLDMHYNYYDHRDAMKDMNCVFPLERLRALEEEGVIGRLAPSMISLGMGRTYKRSLIFNTLAPELLKILHEQEADGVIVVSSWALDHQSTGLVARSIEEGGFPTVSIGSCRDMMAQVRPPRPVFINFPLGRPCGKPHDGELQRSVLVEVLQHLINASEPGEVLDLDHEWGEPFSYEGQMESVRQMVVEEGWPPQIWAPKKVAAD